MFFLIIILMIKCISGRLVMFNKNKIGTIISKNLHIVVGKEVPLEFLFMVQCFFAIHMLAGINNNMSEYQKMK